MLSFEQLIQNLTDTTQPSIVRCSAITNLVSQGSLHGIESLIAVLSDSDSIMRREAAIALQQMGANRAVQPLLEALQAESNDLTLWAMLEAVGELATPDVLPTLESLRSTGPMLTQIEVKKSIKRIKDRYANGGTSTSTNAAESVLYSNQRDPNESPPTADPTDSQTTPEADIVEPESNVPPHGTKGFQTATPDDPFIEQVEDVTTDEMSAVESGEGQPTEFEEMFTSPTVDSDERSVATPEDIHDTPDYTQSTDEPSDITEETESVDEEIGAPDYVQFDDEPNEPIDEAWENPETETPTDTSTTNTESAEREKEDQEINDLAESIARSSRLAGSSVNLPVLAPNAATVPYDPKSTALEPTNFFLTLIHPGRYLSKQWMQRTRAYLIGWAVLANVTIAFTQNQKHTKIE